MDNKRPVIKQLVADKDTFWDVPTTLHTLKKLFDKAYPSTNVVGSNIDSDDWIKDEVNNFVGAISILIDQDISFMKLDVSFWWISYSKGQLVETLVSRQ